MIGHEVAFSETNTGRWVALCSCGWSSPACGDPSRRRPPSRAKDERDHLIRARAERHYTAHLVTVTADIEARSARVIERNAEAVSRLIPTMLRPGRFGAGN